jgi:acyl-CoA synthetase (NDP forming)
MHSLKEIMESTNIAIIGASHDPLKPGAMLLKLLKDTGFQGQVAGVNPQGGDIHGIPLYRTLEEIPFPVELAVLLIPPESVPQALTDCARKGVKGAIISSEGFAETGPQGAQYQEEVRTILRSTGIRGFGPNTMGIVNTTTGLTTSYYSTERMLKPGSIGIATQSGIFVGALLRYLCSFEGLGISKGLGLGNKVDVDESESLSYLAEDEQTRIVALYLEDIRNGREFVKIACNALKRKPVLMLKGGRTPAGARATATHTASMAVDDVLLDGVLRQAGVLRMRDIDELVGTLKGFQFMPLPRGNQLAFVTYSGAQAIMSIDAAADSGVTLAHFSNRARRMLSKVIATPSKAQNPVDLFPDMLTHSFEKTAVEVLSALLADDGVHGIIFISFATFGADPYIPLVELIERRLTKPVLFSLLGEKEKLEECKTFLEGHRIPAYFIPEMAVRVFAHMYEHAERLGRR